jgi:hypothetical protein
MRQACLRIALGAVVAACTASCSGGSGGAPTSSAKPSAAAATTAPPSSSAKPPPDQMPPITVDDLGPFIAGQRSNLKEADGMAKLKKVVSELPIQGKQVELVVLKKAKVPDVFVVVRELAAAGAPTIKIKADSRDDLPSELVVTPASKLGEKPPACAVVAMVSKNLATDVWGVKGGTGKRHVKGFAGPDLSNAGETLKKAIKKCDSKIAFFSAEDTLDWELAHMIGGAVIANDEEKKIATLVLLDEVPVPGRPVKGFGE